MKTIIKEAILFGQKSILKLDEYNKKDDGIEWKKHFNEWKKLKLGMKDYGAREPNFPEGLSEVAFCIFSGSKKFRSIVKGRESASFDTFNTRKNKAEQIKATSVENDLTSFGPKSKWDDLYFLDFYNNGKLNGTFNIYKIPSKFIYSTKVNKKETFKEQQEQKRRPRLSIKESIIKKFKLKPIAKNVKVW